MITITIDGAEAMLSSDFSLDLTRSNPFFDRAGDYTYEVELSLLNKVNSRLYQGMKRPNTKSYPTGRRVIIRNNTTILMDGEEILLSKDGYAVKIQVVANESQLSFAASNSKLHELELPNPYVPLDDTFADETLFEEIKRGSYPEYAYALPVLLKSDDVDTFQFDLNDRGHNVTPYRAGNCIPQPYVLWVIDKVIEALGFSVGNNYLHTVEKYKHLCLVNRVLLDDTKLRLPDWSVAEFITEIEKFFGVVFLCDSVAGTVDVATVDNYYSHIGTTEIPDDCVLDIFDVELPKDASAFSAQYQNVRYQGADGDYWLLADLDPFLYNRTRKESKQLEVGVSERDNVDEYDYVIYDDEPKELEWINFRDSKEELWPSMVNQFRRYVESDDVSSNVLKIAPAVTKLVLVGMYNYSYFLLTLFPSLNLEKRGVFSDAVRGDDDFGTDRMEVAYCVSCNVYYHPGSQIRPEDEQPPLAQGIVTRYTQISVDRTYPYYPSHVIEFGKDAFAVGGYLYGQNYLDYTLSLRGDHGRVETELKNDLSIDTTKRYTFTFLSREWLSPKPIFLINGRRYICAELRYHVENCKLSHIIEGDFYPLKD